MKQYLYSVLLIAYVFFGTITVPIAVPVLQTEAFADFPTFISGSESKIKSSINKKGKSTLSIMSLVGVIVCGGSMIWGAIKLANNNKAEAKGYLVGGGTGLLIIALVFSFIVFFGKV